LNSRILIDQIVEVHMNGRCADRAKRQDYGVYVLCGDSGLEELDSESKVSADSL
jgi:hypothetical protein